MKTALFTMAVVAFSATAATAQDAGDDQMLALTQNVLRGITGQAPATPEAKAPDLSSLITQAMQEGQSDAYLDALIIEAVDQGTIEVPEAMMSTDGEVDTKTLLASLVSQSMQEASVDDALVVEAGGTSNDTAEPRLHTVASGESLAGIALLYYGEATDFDIIFDANRDTIDRPNLIRVGQVIRIP